ncbi:MAG: dihydrolipoamide acyltransferase [Betaproteobacteria bacterium]|nr:dihydrolipoamide acyltransferase [Betaproteobacteria bacterium]
MSVGYLRMLAVCLLCATIAACSNMPAAPTDTVCVDVSPAPLPPSQPLQASRIEKLMLDYDDLGKLPVTELGDAYQKASQDYSQTASDSSRLRLAMLLALPDTPFHDTTAALNLLNNWPKDEGTSPSALHGFTRLLSTLLMQQQRSGNAFNDLEKKLKEEQKRAEILQSKIDAIKDMEKNPINGNKPQ